MVIKLINCDIKLKEIGIDMVAVGSGSKLNVELDKITTYLSWDYVHAEDSLEIYLEDGSETPDLSRFGTIVESGEEG